MQAKRPGPTAILSLHKEFQRDRTEYGQQLTAWITHPISYVDQKDFKSVPHRKLWLVVQGFDVTRKEEQAARAAASESGVGAVLVAKTRIDQSYEPRVTNSKAQ